MTTTTSTSAGAAAYSPLVLRFIYDYLVHGLYCPYVWRCPSGKLRAFFIRHVLRATVVELPASQPLSESPGSPPSTVSSLPKTRRILDIGVGTGYFLEHTPIATGTEVVLADLNPACLDAARSRTTRTHPGTVCRTVVADFLDLEGRGLSSESLGNTGFDAISLMLLLHCLPGPPARKAAALVRLRLLLRPGGVLFGATVLGRGVRHSLAGRFIMFWHNLLGVFGNRDDDIRNFVGPLEEAFEHVRWEVCGAMLLFEASNPKPVAGDGGIWTTATTRSP